MLVSANPRVLFLCLGLVAAWGCSSTDFGSKGSSTVAPGSGNATPAGNGAGSSADGGQTDAGNGGGSGSNSSDSGAKGGSLISKGDGTHPPKVPQFGLLVNNLECSFCHLQINGDIASTQDVSAFYDYSSGSVNGTWFVNGNFDAKQPTNIVGTGGVQGHAGDNVNVNVSGGVQQQAAAASVMPRDASGKVVFPTLDFGSLDSKMSGHLSAGAISFDNVHTGNLVLVGTKASPIQVTGEVLIKGDLVIKGYYKGIANIYVTGNIYIPGDLLATASPFPYSTIPAIAMVQAQAALAANMDALALATPHSVFVSDIESHPMLANGQENSSVFEHPFTPPQDQAAVLGVANVYNWIPGGAAGYDALYDTFDIGCVNSPDRGQNHRSLSRIDAFLYAQQAVGGRANLNSYSINGGVIADNFHIVSGAINCSGGTHPVHKQDQRSSYVNYDWRMKAGLLLLKQFGSFFTH